MSAGLIGYLAVDIRTGETVKLNRPDSPRRQLLQHFGRKHAERVYVDIEAGRPRHCGYIVAGRWFDIHEVHEWAGGRL